MKSHNCSEQSIIRSLPPSSKYMATEDEQMKLCVEFTACATEVTREQPLSSILHIFDCTWSLPHMRLAFFFCVEFTQKGVVHAEVIDLVSLLRIFFHTYSNSLFFVLICGVINDFHMNNLLQRKETKNVEFASWSLHLGCYSPQILNVCMYCGQNAHLRMVLIDRSCSRYDLQSL